MRPEPSRADDCPAHRLNKGITHQFKRVCEAAGIGRDWQPRETRHSFVSIASDNGVPVEDIADAVGHVNSNVTRAVYRHQIADTVTRAPAAMDRALAGESTA